MRYVTTLWPLGGRPKSPETWLMGVTSCRLPYLYRKPKGSNARAFSARKIVFPRAFFVFPPAFSVFAPALFVFPLAVLFLRPQFCFSARKNENAAAKTENFPPAFCGRKNLNFSARFLRAEKPRWVNENLEWFYMRNKSREIPGKLISPVKAIQGCPYCLPLRRESR